MRIRTTASLRSRFDMPRRTRAVAVLLAAAGLYALGLPCPHKCRDAAARMRGPRAR